MRYLIGAIVIVVATIAASLLIFYRTGSTSMAGLVIDFGKTALLLVAGWLLSEYARHRAEVQNNERERERRRYEFLRDEHYKRIELLSRMLTAASGCEALVFSYREARDLLHESRAAIPIPANPHAKDMQRDWQALERHLGDLVTFAEQYGGKPEAQATIGTHRTMGEAVRAWRRRFEDLANAYEPTANLLLTHSSADLRDALYGLIAIERQFLETGELSQRVDVKGFLRSPTIFGRVD